MPPSSTTPSPASFFDRLFPRRARRRVHKAGSAGNWPTDSEGGGGGSAVAARPAFASAPAEPPPPSTTRTLSALARPASAPHKAPISSRPAPPRQSSSSSSSRTRPAWRTGAAVAGAFVAGAAAAVVAGRAPRPGSGVAKAFPPPPPPPKPPKESAPLRALPRSIPPRGHEDHTFVRRGLLRSIIAGGPGWDLAERRVSADALPLPPPQAKSTKTSGLKARLPAAVAAAGGWTARQAGDKVRRAVADAGDRLAGDSVSKVGSAVRKPLSKAGRAVVGVLPRGLRRQAKDAVRGM